MLRIVPPRADNEEREQNMGNDFRAPERRHDMPRNPFIDVPRIRFNYMPRNLLDR